MSEVLAMILVNSCDLMRLDLDGVTTLTPHLVKALEAVLTERELKLRPTNVTKTELRRAAINILVSMLALPTHFKVDTSQVYFLFRTFFVTHAVSQGLRSCSWYSFF